MKIKIKRRHASLSQGRFLPSIPRYPQRSEAKPGNTPKGGGFNVVEGDEGSGAKARKSADHLTTSKKSARKAKKHITKLKEQEASCDNLFHQDKVSRTSQNSKLRNAEEKAEAQQEVQSALKENHGKVFPSEDELFGFVFKEFNIKISRRALYNWLKNGVSALRGRRPLRSS